MKTFVAALIATAFTISAVPAFACDGHGSADATEGGDTLMTSAEGQKDAKKTKKKKEAKKEDEKKEAEGGEV